MGCCCCCGDAAVSEAVLVLVQNHRWSPTCILRYSVVVWSKSVHSIPVQIIKSYLIRSLGRDAEKINCELMFSSTVYEKL